MDKTTIPAPTHVRILRSLLVGGQHFDNGHTLAIGQGITEQDAQRLVDMRKAEYCDGAAADAAAAAPVRKPRKPRTPKVGTEGGAATGAGEDDGSDDGSDDGASDATSDATSDTGTGPASDAAAGPTGEQPAAA